MRSPIDGPPWLRHVPPVCDETSIVDLEVRGALPATLTGQYVRIGPNALGPGPGCSGRRAPMVHAVTIAGGRAIGYRNRWVVTDQVARTLGTDPVAGPVDPDGCLTEVHDIDGGLVATGPGPVAYELGRDLTTTRKRAVDDRSRRDPSPHPPHPLRLVEGVAHRSGPASGADEVYVGSGWIGDLVEVPDAVTLGWLIGMCHRQHETSADLSIWPVGAPGRPVAEVVIPRALPPAAHSGWVRQPTPGRRPPPTTHPTSENPEEIPT